MKSSYLLICLMLGACATTHPPPGTAAAGLSDSTMNPGVLTISGEDLKRTGRIELPDALRASSPIFQ